MHLTQFTDYSLRTILYVSVKNEKCTIKEISQAYRISENHLVKIVHKLGQIGVLKTVRGKGGGVYLAQSTKMLNLKKLVCDLEPNLNVVECNHPKKGACVIQPACRLKKVLNQAKLAFMNALAGYTIADMIQNIDDLKALLHLNTVSPPVEQVVTWHDKN